MNTLRNRMRPLAAAATFLALTGYAGAQETASAAKPFQFAGAPCATPPVMHCPDNDCPSDRVINQGPVVEMKTRRTFFLDYPCDLKTGEKVTFVLNLHGGGSYGNWTRNYFPVMDYKEKYRLVIATPNSPTRVWSQADDEYLQNIVTWVTGQVGKENIKAFWLAGHSQGGQTSNRLLMTGFFRSRLTGWVSLSGGRLGSKRSEVRAAIPFPPGGGPAPAPTAGGGRVIQAPGVSPGSGTASPAEPAAAPGATPAGPTPAGAAAGTTPGLVADASILPDYAFSHIYVTGEHELTPAGMPDNSRWAQKLKCEARVRQGDVVDTKAGYVYDGTRQNPPTKVWGRLPRPGSAEVYVYSNCENGNLVADIIRRDKGHTEGLEPKVTEEIVKLMLSVTK